MWHANSYHRFGARALVPGMASVLGNGSPRLTIHSSRTRFAASAQVPNNLTHPAFRFLAGRLNSGVRPSRANFMASVKRHWIFVNASARVLGIAWLLGGAYFIYHALTLNPAVAAGIRSTMLGSASRDYLAFGVLICLLALGLLSVKPIDPASGAIPKTLNGPGNWLTGLPKRPPM